MEGLTTEQLYEAIRRNPSIRLHNARLIAVRPDDAGNALMTIDYSGMILELKTGLRWDPEHSIRDVGQYGYVQPAYPYSSLILGYCYFRPYLDQSLRRVPELDSQELTFNDSDGRVHAIIGWRCDDLPLGFRAPIGIVPGEDGSFVLDETIPVTLRVPPEFVRECRRVQLTPEEVLRSFVGDLAGIRNYASCPRADGYDSNGSDERDFAAAWLQRAHGMDAINLEALEESEEVASVMHEEFAALLDEYQNCGGNVDALLSAVQAMIENLAEQDGL